MKTLTITIEQDSQIDTVKDKLKDIPGIIIQEAHDEPNYRQELLDSAERVAKGEELYTFTLEELDQLENDLLSGKPLNLEALRKQPPLGTSVDSTSNSNP